MFAYPGCTTGFI